MKRKIGHPFPVCATFNLPFCCQVLISDWQVTLCSCHVRAAMRTNRGWIRTAGAGDRANGWDRRNRDVVRFRDTCLATNEQVRFVLCPAPKLEPAIAWFADNLSMELWMAIFKWLETYLDAENRELERVRVSFWNLRAFDMLNKKK